MGCDTLERSSRPTINAGRPIAGNSSWHAFWLALLCWPGRRILASKLGLQILSSVNCREGSQTDPPGDPCLESVGRRLRLRRLFGGFLLASMARSASCVKYKRVGQPSRQYELFSSHDSPAETWCSGPFRVLEGARALAGRQRWQAWNSPLAYQIPISPRNMSGRLSRLPHIKRCRQPHAVGSDRWTENFPWFLPRPAHAGERTTTGWMGCETCRLCLAAAALRQF
jgi:hypothetical protein